MLLVATEDELSEAVALRLVAPLLNGDLSKVRTLGRQGNGYLKRSIRKFCETAQRLPVLLLTDLDAAECPATLLSAWLGDLKSPRDLVFRVVVREIETRLLADRSGMASFLGIAPAKTEAQPERIKDPKRYLLQLAKKAHRDVREDLVPAEGIRAAQGFGYNRRLRGFVETLWSADRASEASASLKRARTRIDEINRPAVQV
jgi:hypothetical protein